MSIISLEDSLAQQATLSDKDGYFQIGSITWGYYRLKISYVGMQILQLDSIYFRAERNDFNLNDLTMKPASSEQLAEVIIYSEKPLVEQTHRHNMPMNRAG